MPGQPRAAAAAPLITDEQFTELIDQLGARILPLLTEQLGDRAMQLVAENARTLITEGARTGDLDVEGLLATSSSAEVGNVIPALFEARKEFDKLTKNKENPHFGSSYADLAQVLAVTAPGLSKHGLMLDQGTIYLKWSGELEMFLQTRIWHIESLEWLQAWWWVNPVKKDPQGYGSAITYGRRYPAQTKLGLAGEDDDGEQASQRPAPSRPPQPTPPPASISDEEGQQVVDQLKELTKADDVRALWKRLAGEGKLTDQLKLRLTNRAVELDQEAAAAAVDQAAAEQQDKDTEAGGS